ncbi:hypothetical protein EMIT0P12_10477 [Pseudomonas sp. IT-P12]|jgi:hypothetical protein
MNRAITDHRIVMPRFDKRVKTYALIMTQVFDAVFASSL